MERRANGPLDVVEGYEVDGEGVCVYRISSSTLVQTSATFLTGLSTNQGAWVSVRNHGSGASRPAHFEVQYNDASIFVTAYTTSFGTPSSNATIDVLCKGIRSKAF